MRETGYYWITVKSGDRIGYYNSKFNKWTICGYEEVFSDSEFDEIDEKQIKRE